MYKVLIAEDELFIRLGIKNSIAWEKYNMQVICDVENGQAAWDNIQKYSPDIILTDILMPIMDGQQLIEKIQDLSYTPYIIVITCLEDFKLVTKLLSKGIRDYMLKATMTEEEIGKCLKRAQLFFQKETSSRRETSDIRFVSKSDRCNEALESYFQGQISLEQTVKVLDSGRIHIDNSPFVLALCPIEAVYDYQENSIPIPSKNIYQNLFDLLQHRSYREYTHYSFIINEKYYIIILRCKPDSRLEEMKASAIDCFSMIHEDIQDLLHIRVSFILRLVENGLAGLKSSYQQSMEALERHYLDGMNSMVCSWNNNVAQKIDYAYKELSLHQDWIARSLGKSAEDQYKKLVDDFRQNVAKSKEEMIYSFMAISHFLCSFFKEHLEDEHQKCDKLLVRYPYLTEGVSTLSCLLNSCEQYYLQYQKTHYRKEIDKAIQIINHNLEDSDLSLSFICKQVGLSEAYFSTLFRKEMEIPFVKYLTNVRIERAKYLLGHTDCKIYDIAVQTGFKDDTYFSRVFKKVTGISPSEWRSLW